MSVTIEEERLDVSLDDSPPCTVNVDGRACGKPAVSRIRVHCGICRLSSLGFICKFHYDLLIAGSMSCTECRKDEFTWRET